ncbi:hypothetical protein [Streptomyces bugieae]|uniref:SseB protein N-terminal domain-containing protein n=1 Tax=Streptomyces bugieae TaxID=3098223 RepID=A0ABU7NPY4_9ACTN|nr:hypothetical protein [Streptomyces sp. DSM 41528]
MGNNTQAISAALKTLADLDEQELEVVLETLAAGAQSTEDRRDHGRLLELYRSFSRRNEFKVGQLVTWKPHMRNRKLPEEGEPAIVVDFLTEPLYSERADEGSPYFREPLDLILAMIDDDGDLLCFHFDSRRFQPYE